MSSKKPIGIALLKKGRSYSRIRKLLGVSKSTINHWFNQLPKNEQDKIKVFRIKN